MDITYNEQEANDATEQVKKLLSEINDMKQNRSNFALTHFVVMQHDTVGRQRMQVLDELEALMFAVEDMKDTLSLNQLDIQDLQNATGDVVRNEIKIGALQRSSIRTQMQINSHTREIAFLLGVLGQLPEYTREQFEAEESDYWQARLSRQAILSQRGAFTGMGEGNLDAILQLTVNPGDVRKIGDPGEVVAASLPPATPAQSLITQNAIATQAMARR